MKTGVMSAVCFSIASLALSACDGSDHASGLAADAKLLPEVAEDKRTEVNDDRLMNAEATIPSQCYTDTQAVHNPCYTCHQVYKDERFNRLTDGGLQGSYMFSEVGETNHWTNLFVDRSDWVAAVSDKQIDEYVNTENYSQLPERLKQGDWQGFIPDLADYHLGADAFDHQGLARDGSGWVAFNYKPFPGTFWPTNGSTDDVVIRLSEKFRTLDGEFNRDVYFINLTLAELSLKDEPEATINSVDERTFNTDLDMNGVLDTATKVVRRSHYIGDASDVALTFQQLPTGTEFMHSVRYVGVDSEGATFIPPRMKELRYMVKVNTFSQGDIQNKYDNERKEKFLGLLPKFINRFDNGFDNGMGWFVQGYIEDYDGALRPQSFEERLACMGCHSAIGTTIDNTFSLARKVPGAEGWGYIDTRGMKDAPSITEQGGEIYNYFRTAGGGSEFRSNPEIVERWFDQSGQPDAEKMADADVYTLISPSPERARALNKTYTHIVPHQSFIKGRDATVSPPVHVKTSVENHTPPLQDDSLYFGWDIRLNWQ